jgi:RNA polymerase sigma factor (sigma-70 family)
VSLSSTSEILTIQFSEERRYCHMAEKKQYRIRLKGGLVEVTKEVYTTYYRMERHAKTLVEKDERNGLVSYQAMDNGEMLGEEAIPDIGAASVEDAAMAQLLGERLHQCMALLPDAEQKLIHALYFEELTERQYAERVGIPHMTIHDRKAKILRKLKKLLES